MAIIPEFPYDIFISYAHVDNRRSTNQSKGWVDEFHNELSLLLIQYFGVEPRIWYDNTKLDSSTIFDSSIKKGIINSAIIICINSPSYNTSKYCQEELEFFYAKANENLVVADRSRIIHVLLSNIPHKTWPKQLAGTTGFRFFTSKGADHFGDRHKIKSAKFEKEMQALRDSIANLAKDIRKRQESDSPIKDENKIEIIEQIIISQKHQDNTNSSVIINPVENIIESAVHNDFEASFNKAIVDETTNVQQVIPGLAEGKTEIPDNTKSNKYLKSENDDEETIIKPSKVVDSQNKNKGVLGTKVFRGVKRSSLLLLGLLLISTFVCLRLFKTAAVPPKIVNGNIGSQVKFDNKKIRELLLDIIDKRDSSEGVQAHALSSFLKAGFAPEFIVNLRYDDRKAHPVPVAGQEYLSGLFSNKQVTDVKVVRFASYNNKIDSIDVVEIHKKQLVIKNK